MTLQATNALFSFLPIMLKVTNTAPKALLKKGAVGEKEKMLLN